jgi:hypothetical protein
MNDAHGFSPSAAAMVGDRNGLVNKSNLRSTSAKRIADGATHKVEW